MGAGRAFEPVLFDASTAWRRVESGRGPRASSTSEYARATSRRFSRARARRYKARRLTLTFSTTSQYATALEAACSARFQ